MHSGQCSEGEHEIIFFDFIDLLDFFDGAFDSFMQDFVIAPDYDGSLFLGKIPIRGIPFDESPFLFMRIIFEEIQKRFWH